MSCIYYIWYGHGTNPKDGYIGKDSSDDFQRIYSHVHEAYTGGNLYGSEYLIRQYGASGVRYTAFTAEENYGIPNLQEIKRLMTEKNDKLGYWTFENDKDLELAELLHIVYARVSGTGLSLRNVNIGGDNSLKLTYHAPQTIQDSQKNNQRLTTIEVSQWNKAELYKKILYPVQYRWVEELVRKKVESIWQDAGFQAEMIEICLKEDKDQARETIRQRIIQDLQKDLTIAFKNAGYSEKEINNWNIQFDTTAIVEFVYSIIQKRWDFATAKTIRLNKGEGLEKALEDVIFRYIKGDRQGQAVDVKVPVAAIQSIDFQPKTFPEWYNKLAQDLGQLILKRAQDKNDPANGAKNAAWKASANFFIQVYEEIEGARRNAYAELHQVATADTVPVITTLSQKMKQAYSEKGLLSASSVLFQHWVLFYDDMMQYLRQNNKLPELIYLTKDKDKLTRKGEGYYVYQGQYLAGIKHGWDRAQWGRNTRNNLRHWNYF